MDNKELKEVNITVPRGWHEIPLHKWERLYVLKPQTHAEMVRYFAIMCDVEEELLRELEAEVFFTITSLGEWILQDIRVEPSTKATIGGVDYCIRPEDKITTGEWVDVDEVQKAGESVLSNVLAILCRPAGEAYDPDKSVARQKMFAETKVSSLLPILAFTAECGAQSGRLTKSYNALLELQDQLPKSGALLRAIGAGIRSFRIYATVTFCVSMLSLSCRLRRLLRILSTGSIKRSQTQPKTN